MKKLLFLTITSLFISLTVSSQEIETKKIWGGYKFMQNGKNLNLKKMEKIMQDNNEALELIQSAKSNQTWGTILGVSGGFLVGLPLGSAIGGGDPQWALAGAGAALIVASIPITKAFYKKTTKAVELYNAGVSSSAYNFNPSFNFNIRGNNIGITMSF